MSVKAELLIHAVKCMGQGTQLPDIGTPRNLQDSFAECGQDVSKAAPLPFCTHPSPSCRGHTQTCSGALDAYWHSVTCSSATETEYTLPRRCTLAVQQQPQQAKKTGAKRSSDSLALALTLADSKRTLAQH